MKLYHYTHRMHANTIMRAGFIRTTDSMVDMLDASIGEPVVWLLDTPSAEAHSHGLEMPSHRVRRENSKRRIRFTVEIDDAVQWVGSDWYKQMSERWREITIRTGGGEEAASHWWVVGRRVQMSEWTEVYDTLAHEVLWRPRRTSGASFFKG